MRFPVYIFNEIGFGFDGGYNLKIYSGVNLFYLYKFKKEKFNEQTCRYNQVLAAVNHNHLPLKYRDVEIARIAACNSESN